MTIPRRARAGLALMLIGVLLPTLAYLYFKTRSLIPVDQSITLAPGTINREFAVNAKARYILGIEFQPTLSRSTIHCMIGIYYSEATDCSGQVSVVDFDWAIRKNGDLIEHGHSTQHSNADQSDVVEAQYSGFDLSPGKYQIVLDVLKDASALAVTNPRLKVRVMSDYYEGAAFMQLFALIGGTIIVCIGAVAMTWSYSVT
jgi:hypothetical protein